MLAVAACCDNTKTTRFETRTQGGHSCRSCVLISLTLCCERHSLSLSASVTPSLRAALRRTQQRAPRAPELPPHNRRTPAPVDGGARGARRHRPHVPTSPYDNVHTSHAHTEHRIPTPSTGSPSGRPCTLTAPLLHPRRRLCMLQTPVVLRHKHGYARTGDGTSLCCHARPQRGPSAPRAPTA